VVDDVEAGEVVATDDSLEDEALVELSELLLDAADEEDDSDAGVESGVPDDTWDVSDGTEDVTRPVEDPAVGVTGGGGAAPAPMTGPGGNGERFLIRRLRLP